MVVEQHLQLQLDHNTLEMGITEVVLIVEQQRELERVLEVDITMVDMEVEVEVEVEKQQPLQHQPQLQHMQPQPQLVEVKGHIMEEVVVKKLLSFFCNILLVITLS